MGAIVGVYVASLIYAVVRYVVFAPENAQHLPAFIVNKGVAMAAALCFALGIWKLARARRGVVRGLEGAAWLRAGVFGAICHIPLALAILQPGYFPEFFLRVSENAEHAPRLSTMGEAIFLFGGLTAAMLYLMLRPTWSERARWGLSLLAMGTLFCHVLAMGLCRGINMKASHGYLPPMWLLSAIGVGLAILVLLGSRPTKSVGSHTS